MYFIRHEIYKLLCRLLSLLINENNEANISESLPYPVSRNLMNFNPFNVRLNPICHLLALLGAHHILHLNRIRVNWYLPHLIADTFGKWFMGNTGKSFYDILQTWFLYASLWLEV
jgi:hypothetical protein